MSLASRALIKPSTPGPLALNPAQAQVEVEVLRNDPRQRGNALRIFSLCLPREKCRATDYWLEFLVSFFLVFGGFT